MGDGISTRVQKEIAQLQQGTEKLRSEMEAMGNQLRAEFRTDFQSGLDVGLAKISSELKLTLAGLFQQREAYSQASKGSPSDVPKSPIVEIPASSTSGSTLYNPFETFKQTATFNTYALSSTSNHFSYL
ncbi:hypothetical protein COLO4_20880 [Corchorus olitorius]|uniref:Uncharacterized protein n=1 Tax=Corchorus olitorius TaxID=93759 RepID=A0A1R3IWB3_9ROSI|nr:hypothetical protein COLO4_20880 [Corchorus olitorius]